VFPEPIFLMSPRLNSFAKIIPLGIDPSKYEINILLKVISI